MQLILEQIYLKCGKVVFNYEIFIRGEKKIEKRTKNKDKLKIPSDRKGFFIVITLK